MTNATRSNDRKSHLQRSAFPAAVYGITAFVGGYRRGSSCHRLGCGEPSAGSVIAIGTWPNHVLACDAIEHAVFDGEARMRRLSIIILLSGSWTALAEPNGSTSLSATWPVPFVEDADLHAVVAGPRGQFWAVGDRGAIWRRDAAGNWQVQLSGTTAPLFDIDFAGAVGVAVGGMARPYGLPSQAVTVRTTDGGDQWQAEIRDNLPLLHSVASVDNRMAAAVGIASPLFPLGIFQSTDGGRRWHNGRGLLPRQQTTAIRAADLTIPTQVLGIPDLPVMRPVRVVRWLSDGTAMAVGDRGLVLRSEDGGKSWQACMTLPANIAAHFDFRALGVFGPNVWIAGSPGSVIFASHNHGQQWNAVPTGQLLPIYDIVGTDNHVVAVGAAGTRLMSDDSGTNWNVEGGNNGSTAAVVVCRHESDIPLALLAELAAVERYRTRLLMVDAGESLVARARIRTAVAATGCGGVTWSGAEIDNGQEALFRRLVAELRTWRPQFVVAARDIAGDDRLRQTVIEACEKSGDADVMPDPTAVVALSPWRPTRIYQATSRELAGVPSRSIDLARAAPALRQSMVEIVGWAETLLQRDSRQAVVRRRQLQFVPTGTLGLETTRQGAGWMDGTVESERARIPMPMAEVDIGWLDRQATQQYRVTSLIDTLLARSAPGAETRLGALAGELSSQQQSQCMIRMANQLVATGQSGAAIATLEMLMRRKTDDVYAEAAALKLFRLQTSKELRRHLTASQPNEAQATAGIAPALNVGSPAAQFTNRSAERIATSPPELVQNLPPQLAAIPWIQMAQAYHRRSSAGLSFVDQTRIYRRLARSLPMGDWRRAAEAEAWFVDPAAKGPKPQHVLEVPGFATRPQLDGQFAEPTWATAVATTLSPIDAVDDSSPRTEIRWGLDAEFLYLAVNAARGENKPLSEPRDTQPRQRDTDLSSRDRVAIHLDVDRDYCSGYHLVVDDRGWANDACLQDASWDPEWFIAAWSDASRWQVEAAIPRDALGIKDDHGPWLLSVQRMMPSERASHVQSWPPADEQQHAWQRCGYLFMEASNRSR